jgi:hypothetical protein
MLHASAARVVESPTFFCFGVVWEYCVEPCDARSRVYMNKSDSLVSITPLAGSRHGRVEAGKHVEVQTGKGHHR